MMTSLAPATTTPASAGRSASHGTDKPSLNARNVDWTRGCISLENADVAELVTLVPIGTLVLIEDCQGAGSGGSSETRYERRVYPAALSLPAP